jgi:tRNA A58 N-methylase Trm61
VAGYLEAIELVEPVEVPRIARDLTMIMSSLSCRRCRTNRIHGRRSRIVGRRRGSRLIAGWGLAMGIALIAALVLAVVSAVHLTQLTWNEPRQLVQRLGIEPGMRVADVGAGSGWLAIEVARP